MRLIALLLLAWVCCAQTSASAPSKEPAAPAPPNSETAAPNATRTQLNLLGQTDSSAGESRRNENIQFNLIDNNALKELNTRLGVTATFVSVFEVNRNYFGAEYGTPPTTPHPLMTALRNAWHGNVYYTHQNSILAARAFFQVGGVKPARENDYGFNVGGPVWRKGSLQVEGSQKKLRGQVNGNVLVPRPGERTPLATDPAVRRYVQQILDLYPAETPNRPDIDPRMLNTNSPQTINNDSLAGRLDQSLGSRDTLVARHAFLTQRVKAFQLVKGQNPDTSTMSHTSNLTWNRAWSATTVTSFAVGFERVHTLIVPEKNNLGPQIFISNALTAINPQNAVPIDRVENKFRYSGNWRQVRGRHQLTAGFALLRRQLNGYEGDSQLGAIQFNNNLGNDAITNLRLGLPIFYYTSIAILPLERGFRNWDNFFYAGDVWQAHRKLTISYGVSWRPITRPMEVNRLNDVGYPSDWNNVGPSLGLAWRPREDARWGVVRLAYGMHHGEIFPVTFQSIRFNAPNNIKLVIPDPDLLNPLSKLPADISKAGRTVLYAFAKDLATPYAHQYNLKWEVPVGKVLRVEAGYIGSRASKLLQRWYLNRARQAPGLAPTSGNIDARRPLAQYADIRYTTSSSRGYYDAMKLGLVVPRWRGISLESAYTWSKAMDLGSSYTNTAYDQDGFNNRSQTDDETHKDLKGRSDFDQPHAFLARGTYALPWGGRKWGRWSINGVFLGKVGTPFNLKTGSDAPGFGNVDGISGDRPNLLDPSILGNTVGHPDRSRQQLPRSAFAYIPVGQTTGNLGRNVFRRGGIRNLNASVASDWTLKGDLRLNFRAESINLTNTAQFAEPGSSLTDPNFGVITNTLNDGRALRFQLRLSF
ncbi:MAG: hypothetical protein ACK555_20050 [Acidobacteriota bacterium]